jgi:hypothetical protein
LRDHVVQYIWRKPWVADKVRDSVTDNEDGCPFRHIVASPTAKPKPSRITPPQPASIPSTEYFVPQYKPLETS